MDEKEFTLSLINKEMDESFNHLDRQHKQTKWFVQLYMAFVAGFFALAGFMGTRENILGSSQSSLPSSFIIVGITSAILIFFAGWTLLAILGHKVFSVLLIHKHMATLRFRRLQLLGSVIFDGYAFVTQPNSVTFPRMINYLPYTFFIINYAILLGSIIFFTYSQIGIENSIILGMLVATIIGLFYPRVCITFNKHIWAARLANSFIRRQQLEQKWEAFRSKKRNYRIRNYIVLTILTGVMIIIQIISIVSDNLYTNYLLCASVLGFTIFGTYRYKIETHFVRETKREVKRQESVP